MSVPEPRPASAAPRHAIAAHLGPRRALRVLSVQVGVEQRLFWRSRSQVFFTFMLPLLLLAFFGQFRFAKAEVLVPGIAALAIVSTTFQSLAIAIAFHREQGVLKGLMATPLPPSMLVGGKVVSASAVAALEVAIVLAAGRYLFGVGLPVDGVAFLAAFMLGVLAFSTLGIAFTSLIPNGDAAPSVVNAVYLPMMFVSGVFYEVSALPQALRGIAYALPMYHLVVPMQRAWTGACGGRDLVHLAVLAAWGVVAMAWAVRAFRFAPSSQR